MSADIHGILLLDKPLGLTSARAVARVKWLFGARKAGHTGSLDPLASGMLPICFGEATKFGAHLLDADKTYRVTARLGQRTASADRETEVIEERAVPPFTADQMRRALAEFPREYLQVPPMHSAIKQGGRPLYEYARAGVTRERAPRPIVIHALEFLEWRTPDLSFDVRCSKGAYIRVLAEDLAARLDTIAHLTALRRICVAPFATERLWSFEALEALDVAQRQAALLPVDAALTDWRIVHLAEGSVSAFRQGQAVAIAPDCPGNVRIYAAELGFLGLAAIEPAGRVIPLRLVAADLRTAPGGATNPA
jgi:tRNA pseudouridine55 synthase